MEASAPIIDTGERGLSYLRHQLEYGGVLAKLLLRAPLARGRVITSATNPSDLPDNFDTDLDQTVARLQWDFTIDLVFDFLRQPGEPVVVFEHPFATPGQDWLKSKPVPHVTCGDDVLFLINSSWAQRDRVELALVTAGAQNELGVLGRNRVLSQKLDGEVSQADLEKLVESLEGIVLRAFDAAGYLVWIPMNHVLGRKPS